MNNCIKWFYFLTITRFNATNNRGKVKTSHCRTNGYANWQCIFTSLCVIINYSERRMWGSYIFLRSYYFLLFERRTTMSSNTKLQCLCHDADVLYAARPSQDSIRWASVPAKKNCRLPPDRADLESTSQALRTGRCAAVPRSHRELQRGWPTKGGSKHTIIRLIGHSMWTT